MLLYDTHSLYNLLPKFVYNYWFLFIFPLYPFRRHCHSSVVYTIVDAPSVSVHLANEEPIPSRLIIRSEHDNVTLKCRANANPPVESNSFGWYKNVRKVYFCVRYVFNDDFWGFSCVFIFIWFGLVWFMF